MLNLEIFIHLKIFTEHFLHATHMLKKGTIQNKHVP